MLLYLIALLEGFTTLAVEVIAIRLAVPIVGSSIILTGIVLSVILMALSLGYWRGGYLSSGKSKTDLLKLLGKNLIIAALLYGCISLPFYALTLDIILAATKNLFISVSFATLLLLFLPVYFASQTLPLITELNVSNDQAGASAGKVLFYSTLGSVLGGTITPIVLFETIGVNGSSWAISGILLICYLLILKKAAFNNGFAFVIGVMLLAAPFHNALGLPANYSFKTNKDLELIHSVETPYNSISIYNSKSNQARFMKMNGSFSSGIHLQNKAPFFSYVVKTLEVIEATKPESLLIIGSAGFVMPYWAAKNDNIKDIKAIDLDESVYHLTEKYFLQEKLSDKIKFEAVSARFFVNQQIKENQKYDLIMIDAYSSKHSVPSELSTMEFFEGLKKTGKNIMFNLILDEDLNSAYADNLLYSLKEVFKHIWVEKISEQGSLKMRNFLIANFPISSEQREYELQNHGKEYKDNSHSIEMDRLLMDLI